VVCKYAAYKLWKYADPIGAILICIYILVSWFHMGCSKSLHLLFQYTVLQ